MHSKIAGRLPLHTAIGKVLDNAREKIAAAAEESAPAKTRVQVEKEKISSINFRDPNHIDKLASALEAVGEKLASGFIGGESAQGGEVLQTGTPVSGKQTISKDRSKSHNVPMSTPMISHADAGPEKTLVEDNSAKTPGGAAYPKKGVLKVGSMIQATKEKASSVDFILQKISESTQGGETLDSMSGQGPKPPSGNGGNDARSNISSNAAVVAMKKVDGKKPQKRMLSEVLTEPALSSAHDSIVQDNLRNASKGGVKIAAAREFLKKIAEDPSDPRHEALKAAMEKKKGDKKEEAKDDDKKEKKSFGGGMGGGMPPSPSGTPPMSSSM